jgi:hypothetical protein
MNNHIQILSQGSQSDILPIHVDLKKKKLALIFKTKPKQKKVIHFILQYKYCEHKIVIHVPVNHSYHFCRLLAKGR